MEVSIYVILLSPNIRFHSLFDDTKKLGDFGTIETLEKNEISSSQEAKVLSEFLWKIVDSSIEGAELPRTNNSDF